MNKRVFTIMIALLLAAFVPKAYGQAGDSADNPIEISDYNGLVSMKLDLTKYYKLTEDITIPEDKTWVPPTGAFTGTFDGGGYTISGLKVSVSSPAGLFATIGEGGTVKNFGVIDGSVTSTNKSAGGIAGVNKGTIQNCYTNVTVTVDASSEYLAAGGIAGENYGGTIQNCYTTGAVTNKEGRAGGIAGLNVKDIQNCYATGAISGKQAGGITGEISTGKVLNCIALNASITGTTIGRIAGDNNAGTFTDNHAAPYIPGAWVDGDKVANGKSGDDLTEDNFIKDSAFESTGAFYGWNSTNWDIMTTNSLPWVRDGQGNSIGGQTTIPSAPYLEAPTIKTQKELAAIASDLAGSYKLGGSFTLTDDWTPIAGAFTGTLDGCGFTISGLNVSVESDAGLFEAIGTSDKPGGIVKNLGVIGSVTSECKNPYAGNSAGGIAGKNYGIIQNCYTSVTVTCNLSNDMCSAGGIAGSNHGTIQNCYTTGAVTNEKGYAGGIAGSNANNDAASTIQYCYATGAIKGNQAGGITGNTSIGGSILNCIALNDSINGKGNAPKVGRITGYRENYVTTLTANHAALSIPGAWTGKGAGTENGDDLTEDNFTGASATAFTGWNANSTTNWTFGNNTNLPQVNTDGGTSISGQTASKPRADYLEAPVTTITTKDQLADIKKDPTGSYKLGGNIDLTDANGETWTPIAGAFTGTLDGCGFTISGLKVSVEDNAGLFHTIGEKGTVKNLGVTDGSVTSASASAGSIASVNNGTIQNCYTSVTVTVSNMNSAGGIVSNNAGTILNCYTTGAVTSEKGYAGGIAGENEWIDETNTGTIQNCYATGAIKGYKAGGISGKMSDKGQILNCIALNDSINGNIDGFSVGRILGENGGGTLTHNHAALSIPGVWEAADKGAGTENGADLTEDNFTGKGVNAGAFTGWTAANWDFSSTPDLPILKGFKTDNQPVKGVARKPFLEVPVTTITDKAGLAAIKDNLAGSYKLGNDIDLKDVTWNPIGDKDNPFTGTLDGCGYVIRNLTIKIEVGFEKTGLFHTIGEKGTVKNFGVTGNITARGITGGITGENYGIIQNCYTNVKVTSPSAAGGIAGVNYRIIQNSYTTGAVTSDQEAGGIAGVNMGGDNTATIQNCYATGAIKGYQAGGITGKINTENTAVTNCIALNDSIIGIDKDPQVGRIAGVNMDSGTLYENHAALSIPGAWAAVDKAIDKKNGVDLTEDTFTGKGANAGAFKDWIADNWDFSTTPNLPILKGFKTADQPVNKMERAPFLVVAVTTITDQKGLAAIASNLSGSYKLGDNITLTYVEGETWTPLREFTGTLDGCGYVISGLKVSVTDSNAGLFETIGTGGIVKNLGVIDGSVTATYVSAGSIAGENSGTIQNCYTNVTVTASSTNNAGGIAGKNTGTIQNCYTTGAVTSEQGSAGGIAGENASDETNTATIQNCYATGVIKGYQAGGISGNMSDKGQILNCIALNDSIKDHTAGSSSARILGYNDGGTLTDNYAALSIPGAWAADDKGAGTENGADLTADTFIGASATAFAGWKDAGWDFTTTANLPILKDFKTANQPVKDKKRAPFLEVPVTTIKTKEQLADIASNLTGSYKLGNDIDLKDVNWDPIAGEFTGTLDGCGFVIRNLTVNVTGSSNLAGLFAEIGEKGTVKNLGVTGPGVTAAFYAGSIAGQNFGTIQNCYTSVAVTSTGAASDAGGITGINKGIIQNCYTTGAVTSKNNTGGIAGSNLKAGTGAPTSTIQYCYATGTIRGGKAGGIAGYLAQSSTIQYSIALNDSIESKGTAPVGRIIGSEENGGGTLAGNHAALSIPGAWAADKAIDKKNGADLTEASFTGATASAGAFYKWATTDWDFTTTAANLPTLKDFKTADQPVKEMKRAPFLVVPVTTITDQAGLAAIASSLSGSYKLGGNITLTGNWTPLGNWATPFTGTLDGCGYTISGLNVSITGSTEAYAGLFGYIGKDGTVKNLGVTGSVTLTDATSSVYAGGIAGESYGKITNCYTNVMVSATGSSFIYAGGIVGLINGNAAAISNCFATGDCTANSSLTAIAGGIVGDASPGRERHISYCFATGTVKAEGSAARKLAGGIAGQKGGTITGCIALNKGITGTKGLTNRIAGNSSNACTIADCYASPAIDGTWSYIGATDLDGADLTNANFINSNSAFTGDWTTAGNWQFADKGFANLPTLMTTGLTSNIALAGQTAITRMDCLNLVLIEGAVTYDATKHGGKNLVIASTGNLTVSAAEAQVSSLDIQPGGQVTTTTALGVTKAISTSRTLKNKWIPFGAPVLMKLKAISTAYMLQGYASSEATDQKWTKFDLPASPTSLQAASPYLLATDKGSETVSFSSVEKITIPVSVKVESGNALGNGIFLFRTNPSLSNQTVTNVYILSDDGTRFDRQASYTLKPFECYVTANAVTTKAVQSLRVSNGTPTDNEPLVLPSDAFRLWGADGQLHLEASQPTDVQVYTLTGTLAHSFRLDGSRTLTLPRGIYLVRSNNITYKVSL